MNDGAVFGIFFFSVIALIFGTVYYYLQTRHKERLSLIENGAEAKLFSREPGKRNYFFAMMIGVVFICLALGIIFGVLLDDHVFTDYYDRENPAPYFISIFFFIGVGFISTFVLHKKLNPQ